MLSCYYTTIGFYFTTMITVWTVYVFLYGRLYLSLGGLHEALATGKSFLYTMHLSKLLSLQSFVQLGFLMALPMMMETGLERGLRTALSDFVLMQLRLVSIFFTFSLGTRTHYGTSTTERRCSMEELQSIELLGMDLCCSTPISPRIIVCTHAAIFSKGIEFMILLVVYEIFRQKYGGAIPYIITISIWFMALTWRSAPFLFNPPCFEWQKEYKQNSGAA